MTVDDPAARLASAVAEAMMRRDRIAPGFGIHLEEIRPRFCRVRMTVRDDMLNAHGICHGAVVFALADCAFAYACNAENRSTLATSCTVSFASAARAGDELTAVAEAQVQQNRIGVYDVAVTARDGRVVAVFRGHSYAVGGSTLDALDAGSTDGADS